jgi:hypothetical protein
MNSSRNLFSPQPGFRLGWFLLVTFALTGIAAAADGNNPGELFQQRRQAIVAKFDRNQDGRLDAAERETARAAKKEAAQRGGRRNPMFQMPPEIVEKYDLDKDGQLNDEELRAANDGIRIRWAEAQKEYDRDGDGELNDDERNALGAAIAAGQVQGLPRSFGGMLRRPPGGRQRGGMFGGGGQPVESPLARFDVDKDGRLSEAELAAARKAGAGRPAGP